MSVTAEVDQRQFSALQAKIPGLVVPAAEQIIKDSSAFALREAQTGARGLGGIPSSLRADVRGLEAKVYSRHPGALPMESGRRAGSDMPPVNAFSRYGDAAFVIARAVARRGIKGRFFVRKAQERLEKTELPRLLRAAAETIERRWAAL